MMICPNCQRENADSATFCGYCGGKNEIVDGVVDLYFKKRDNSCQLCGTYAPLRKVSFNQNIGMIVTREYKQIGGNLCKNCINKTFWNFTLITLAVGWLGVISFIVAPIFIIGNVYYYICSLSLPYPDTKS